MLGIQKFVQLGFIFSILLIPWLFIPRVTSAAAAVLSFHPQSQTVVVGQALSARVLLNTGGESVSEVDIRISYPTNLLKADSIESADSPKIDWLENFFSTQSGQLTFHGRFHDGAQNGSELEIAKINFTSQNTGVAQISFLGSSQIIRESDNANVLGEYLAATYTISSISPSPTPTFSLNPTSTPYTTPPAITVTSTPTNLTPTPSLLPKGGTSELTYVVALSSFILLVSGLIVLKRI